MGKKPITAINVLSSSKSIKERQFIYNGGIFAEDLVAAIIVTILFECGTNSSYFYYDCCINIHVTGG